MLPNLNRLSLVATGGNLANAKWPKDEVCSICLFPLGKPSPDKRYTWPFSGDGTGLTAVACVQGHTFHKGCLRFMQRFNDTRCPDCRKPMFAEVVNDVTRPEAEQLERERQQEEARERARAQRAREDREAEERRRNPPAAGPSNAPSIAEMQSRLSQAEAVEYEEMQDVTDFAVQWTFFVKEHIPYNERIWSTIRAFFAQHMSRVREPMDWGRHLGIAVRHGEVPPVSATHASMRIEYTRCRFRMFLPEAAARRFAEWLTARIHTQSYGQAMEEILGIREAIRAGPDTLAPVAVMTGMYDEDPPYIESLVAIQETAHPVMTWQEYQRWPLFEYSAAPAPAAAPQQQVRADDPITNFRPPGWAATDVTIRWRFWLKGPIDEEVRMATEINLGTAFADVMRDERYLPELRTSVDPWFDRLWVWTRAEEPRITGPRSGQPLVPGIVQRCEFALKIPVDVASAFMTIIAQAYGTANWNNLAQTWFYIEPVRSNVGGVDRPQRDNRPLHPLSGAPSMTEAEYNAWEHWRSIPRFRAIGDPR